MYMAPIRHLVIFGFEPKIEGGAPLTLRPDAPDLAPRRKNPTHGFGAALSCFLSKWAAERASASERRSYAVDGRMHLEVPSHSLTLWSAAGGQKVTTALLIVEST